MAVRSAIFAESTQDLPARASSSKETHVLNDDGNDEITVHSQDHSTDTHLPTNRRHFPLRGSTGAESSPRKQQGVVLAVVVAAVHWRMWAARRSREKHGYSARDVAVVDDEPMKAILLTRPGAWCFGLTLLDSVLSSDLLDWYSAFAETEEGQQFFATCGIDPFFSEAEVEKIAAVPNLVFCLVSHKSLEEVMGCALMRRALVHPVALAGDWLLRCLESPNLVAGAISALELVSKDLELNAREPKYETPWDTDVRRLNIITSIAKTPHLLAPMMRLPLRMQVEVAPIWL